MNELLQLVLLSVLGSLVGLCGGILFLVSKRLSALLELNSIPFAAGVLITVSILGLMPEAVEIGGKVAYLTLLVSFFAAYFFEQLVIQLHHHDHDEHEFRGSVAMVILGDTIHNFIDGATIGASFLVSPGLGFITALSTFLHEIPHEIGDFGILVKAKWDKPKVIFVNVLSSLATVVAALLVYYINIDQKLIGTLLAVSAGVFLYLGASDFLPHISEYKANSRVKALVPLVLGVLVMSAILLFVPHG